MIRRNDYNVAFSGNKCRRNDTWCGNNAHLYDSNDKKCLVLNQLTIDLRRGICI